MPDPTARTLRLLSLLQTHRFWPGGELAERLGVSARTLRRDVDRLRELGYPVDASPGVAGGYRLAAGSELPPLLLEDDEAVAIAVGLRTAAGAAIAGIEDASLRALAKLDQVLPSRLRRRVAGLHGNVAVLRWNEPGPLVDPETLTLLAQACRDREEARFEYRRRDGEEASRLVQPHQLVAVGRRWYLVAHDVRRDDWRTFRLDRIADVRLAGARFDERPVPGGDAARFVAESIRATPLTHRATAIVDAAPDEVAPMARWFDTEAVPRADERTSLDLRAESAESLVSMIATLAISFDLTVDAGDDIAQLVVDTVRRLDGARPADTAAPSPPGP